MERLTTQIETVVIGAGAAGLSAAGTLTREGREVVVLEARRRIGGRIHTLNEAVFGLPVEAGAEFIHGRPDATLGLVRDARLTAVDTPFEHMQRKHGRLEKLENFSEAIDPVMRGLSKLKGRDISFEDYLKSHAKQPKLADARAMARAFVQGFDAADPARISAKSLARELKGLGDVGEEKQFRLLEGYGQLMRHLARDTVRTGRATITLGAVVESVRWSARGAEIPGRRLGGRPFRVRARRVIVTLPLGILAQQKEPGAVRFFPDIASKRQAMEKLAFGPVVKIVLGFDGAFWEEPGAAGLAKAGEEYRDLSFMNDPSAEVPTWWTLRPLRTPVLVGWAGGPKAAALSGRSEAEILHAGFRSLAGLTGHSLTTLRRRAQRMRVYDWLADPWSRGAYSYEAVGGTRARAELAKPLQGTLFFAGEATDTDGQASTVAGAIASGERAAREVLSSRRR